MNYKKLDKKVLDVQERVDIVEGIIAENEYIEEQFYNFNGGEPLSKKDKTYTESSIKARYELEKLADYLLGLDSEKFNGMENIINSYKKDIKNGVQQFPEDTYNEENDEYIEFEVSPTNKVSFDFDRIQVSHRHYEQDTRNNPYLLKGQDVRIDIAGKDTLRESDLEIPEFKELWDIRERIRKSPHYKGKSKHLKNILSQLYAIKQHYIKPYQGVSVVKAITDADLYSFDFTNPKHIKALLGINQDNDNLYLKELLLMMGELLLYIELNDTQSIVLKLLQRGYYHDKYEIIAEVIKDEHNIDITRQGVQGAIEAIADKIVEQYIITYKISEDTDIEFFNCEDEKVDKYLLKLA